MSAAKPRRAAPRIGTAEWVLAGLLAVLWAVFACSAPQFRDPQNLLSMTREFAEPGIVALMMTFVIITGGIDLSVGSVLALSAVSLGLFWQHGVPIGLASLLAVGVGALAGCANGALVVWLRIPPLIATLGTMAAYRGIAMGLTKGQSISNFPQSFQMLGGGKYPLPFGLEMPGQLVWLLLLALAAGVFLGRTRYGRYLYAIGMRESSAVYGAVPVGGMKLLVYALTGAASGLAGAVAASHYGTAKPDLGMGCEMDAIAACVLGGVAIVGGRGSITGTLLGLWIVGSLRRGLVYLGMDAQSLSIVIGIVLVLAVFGHQVLAPWWGNLLHQRRTARPQAARAEGEGSS
jgi:rhamnose transport system permease protein